ncbi:retinol dehydrogenase 5 [Pristis pectinata]|uniref:retinol dehydrogenase 5 n=1 Tax=Pristis pectinata TaxID=685728 RepID=UPI00223C95F9|nr:retinol dehydrogenase 5 [Pristis pectinata]XP_051865649.1 retinol dehydrogenase 5 [Pristis pectinata]XP_051865650.1 retinol dehydrogenase 5 [Pristis pectinata]XP_051865651.1 retinol dehydrogenase 5 [Pristis pectinata]XP_051865653.1 retinol dehydrogenase 5 [Pristis pectinata]XP_051865654.1 retinol dehydrogenase 5 [Pristis pectinata]
MWLYLLCAVFLLTVGWFIRDRQKIRDVKDKYVLITGCDTGFGNLLAKCLDRQGFRVLAGCLTQKGVDTMHRSSSSRLKAILLDVTDDINIQKAADWVQAQVGEKGIWGLVNNAGRSIPVGPTEWLKMEDYHKVLNVNLLGLMEVTLTFLPLVKKARGRVVNVASVMGRISFAGGGYCLSKCGVESFSDSLRRDMQYFGVQVSIIEPGFFKTAVTNLESIENDLQRLWDRLSPEVRESYGQKYFEKYLKVQRFCLNTLCDSDLSKVTNCMEHALTAQHPRTRYTAGWDAKLFWIPLSYMPTFLSDFLLSAIVPRPSQSV